ncbi:hypothetical protein KUCAC02_027927 [Chaenocephalus aceratus]|uniref:Uncharacterized protein n=1 Tax=Chaenocephalus aceratus TaxID=36190 RepID=A0ACB9X102_CHAAC|nr:hypothetical protein KUCAC02_027927 [Chaenocephalus aceratus]
MDYDRPPFQVVRQSSPPPPHHHSPTPPPPPLPAGREAVVLLLSCHCSCRQAWRSSLPAEQHEWVSRALFVADRAGRPVLSPELQLWHHPPGPWPKYSQRPYPDAFFQRPFFLWAPYKRWKYHLKCPSCAHKLTGGGLYKTVRRVLDLVLHGDGVPAVQLLHQEVCQLVCEHQEAAGPGPPAALPCCADLQVLAQMKGRTLGNSASRLHSFLVEQHTAEWMRRSIHYLNTCRKLEVAGVQMPPPQPPPQMVPVPSSGWLLSTFVLESFTRIEELKAKVTSTFGSILKMGSTKKVTKKMAGADSGTALCMSSVGNELGQVLMSVLTAAEDRDCCRRDGGTCATAALFPAWPHLAVRLDIWHFIRRLAAGVTSQSHPLYPVFMRCLSSCIFVWDAKDMSLLETALQADGSRRTPSSKEMGRHCRRRTRGAQETERLLTEAVEAFKRATDTMNTGRICSDTFHRVFREFAFCNYRQEDLCLVEPFKCPACTPDMLAIAGDGNRKHYRFKKSRGTDEPSLLDGLFIAQDRKVSAFVDKIRSEMTSKSGRDVCGPATFTACRETSHESRAKALDKLDHLLHQTKDDIRNQISPSDITEEGHRGLLYFTPSIPSGAETEQSHQHQHLYWHRLDNEQDGDEDNEQDSDEDNELDGDEDNEQDGDEDNEQDEDNKQDGDEDNEQDGDEDNELDGEEDNEQDGDEDNEQDGDEDNEQDEDEDNKQDGDEDNEQDGDEDNKQDEDNEQDGDEDNEQDGDEDNEQEF